jgi:4-hydroxy-tetrahydrodipicolinate synthase
MNHPKKDIKSLKSRRMSHNKEGRDSSRKFSKQPIVKREKTMLRGSIVALVTPFRDGQVDEKKLKELVAYQIANGTNGILPCGTTGESPTLTHEEHERVVEICIEAAANRVIVMAGTGSNSTAEAISLTKHAAHAGANAALVVTPYYNKPTQEGLYRHFRAVAESVEIPIILYNIAGRTACNIEPTTMARLANDCQNIVGVKEASGSLEQMQMIKSVCPEDFLLFSGDDALTLPVMSIGGVGIISVAGNIVPKDIVTMLDVIKAGDWDKARTMHYRLLPLIRALFLETNPVPVKTAMGMLGMCLETLRLPLCPMSEANQVKLKTALTQYGLMSVPQGAGASRR